MKYFFKVAVGFALAASCLVYPLSANANAVLRCDGCNANQHYATAASGPLGLTYVVDQPNAGLTLWEVRYDKEMGQKTVEEMAVDPAVYDRYLFMLEGKIQAQASGSNLVVINIGPGQYNGSLFARDPFGGYSGVSAYDVVNSATVRSGLGTNIANAMSATSTGSTILDNLGVTLNSVIMAFGAPSGFKIVITWKDGTKTTFTIDSSTANQAQYAPGESKDTSGNPIPDASATSGDAGNTYAGQYYFDSTKSLENWVQSAINYGIPVTGGATGSRRLSCTWDGRTLSCKYI